jgi:hypothetical protein
MQSDGSNSQYANRWQFKLAAGELELPIAGLALPSGAPNPQTVSK